MSTKRNAQVNRATFANKDQLSAAVVLTLLATMAFSLTARAHYVGMDGSNSADVERPDFSSGNAAVEPFDGSALSAAAEAEPASPASNAWVPFDGWGMLASVETEPGQIVNAVRVPFDGGTAGMVFEDFGSGNAWAAIETYRLAGGLSVFEAPASSGSLTSRYVTRVLLAK